MYNKSKNIIIDTEDNRGRKSVVDDLIIKMDVYRHCIKHSDYMHEKMLKRKSKKCKILVYKKQLQMRKYKVWKKYPNAHKIGKTHF